MAYSDPVVAPGNVATQIDIILLAMLVDKALWTIQMQWSPQRKHKRPLKV
jgi:hypothetical protein